jgi:hypothetical protein
VEVDREVVRFLLKKGGPGKRCKWDNCRMMNKDCEIDGGRILR